MPQPDNGPTTRELQAAVDRVMRGDQRFFARFPLRRHRLRLASTVEMMLNAAVHGSQAIPDEPGARWYVAVKMLAPDSFARAFIQAESDANTDMCEADARYVYDALVANTAAPMIERQYIVGLGRGDR